MSATHSTSLHYDATTMADGPGVTLAPVRLETFVAGRPPLIDLYHVVNGRRLLFCAAHAVFTEEARLSLLANGIRRLYTPVTVRPSASASAFVDLLASSTDEVPAAVKANLLYGSAIAATRIVFASRDVAHRLSVARQVVGAVVGSLADAEVAFQVVIRMMRHDFSIYTHALNVCAYTAALGHAVGLDDRSIQGLSLGAFLHDVAKTRIPRAILDKPGELTSDEWATIRRHPDWGVQLLGAEEFDATTLVAVQQHHERLDGSGYPHHLHGPQVRLAARLVGLVDAYDALTSDRPYRPALTPFEALRTMETQMAGQFDLDLFVAFVRLLGQHRAFPPAGAQPALVPGLR